MISRHWVTKESTASLASLLLHRAYRLPREIAATSSLSLRTVTCERKCWTFSRFFVVSGAVTHSYLPYSHYIPFGVIAEFPNSQQAIWFSYDTNYQIMLTPASWLADSSPQSTFRFTNFVIFLLNRVFCMYLTYWTVIFLCPNGIVHYYAIKIVHVCLVFGCFLPDSAKIYISYQPLFFSNNLLINLTFFLFPFAIFEFQRNGGSVGFATKISYEAKSLLCFSAVSNTYYAYHRILLSHFPILLFKFYVRIMII